MIKLKFRGKVNIKLFWGNMRVVKIFNNKIISYVRGYKIKVKILLKGFIIDIVKWKICCCI